MNENINTTCQECFESCETFEEVCIVAGVHESKNPEDWQIWCYCEKCDIETFHDLQNGSESPLISFAVGGMKATQYKR